MTASSLPTLVIGNKNYSSWSMRAWVLMRQAGIAFDERMLRFDSFAGDSRFKHDILQISPAGRVPVLIDGAITVWDTLAIAEYLAETHPALNLWPVDRAARARARCICAEMHAGFTALRTHFPMNIEAELPEIGERMLREQPAAQADLDRIVELWSDALARSGGPLLFGGFTIADAFFAPVAMRIRGYALPVPPAAAGYVAQLQRLPAVAAWIAGALAEHDFVAEDEPYRRSR